MSGLGTGSKVTPTNLPYSSHRCRSSFVQKKAVPKDGLFYP